MPRLWLLFFASLSVFLIIRSTNGLVWNDSPQTAENLYGIASHSPIAGESSAVCRDAGAYGIRLSQPSFFKTIWLRSFSCLEFGGYRPLSALISLVGVAIFSDVYEADGSMTWMARLWMVGVAILFGLLSVLYFQIARRFLMTSVAALGVLLLYFASPPIVSGAWILFSGGIQVTVPLTICLGIWLYFQSELKDKNRPFYLAALVVVLFLGPWIREFTGVTAILVATMEVFKHRRATVLSGVAIVALLHAVFPTAALHLIIPSLPVASVFKLGSLAAQLGAAPGASLSLIEVLSQLKWEVPKVFFVLFPPSLFVLFYCALAVSAARDRVVWAFFGISGILLLLARESVGLWLGILAVGFGGLLVIEARAKNRAGLTNYLFLLLWFGLSFVPFLKVYSAHVHLAYALLPATIILVYVLERLWLFVLSKKLVWAQRALVAVLVLILLDQWANVYGSYRAVTTFYSGVVKTGGWLSANVPKGSIVIANALHAEDIRLYSKNHMTPFWSVGTGVPPERMLHRPPDLRAFLLRHIGTDPVYMLDIDQDFSRSKGSYHAHKYVTRRTVHLEDLGQIGSYSGHYPYLDPLRLVLPRNLVLFLGPPDLENDFFLTGGREGAMFSNEVGVRYHMYRVKSAEVLSSADILPDNTFLFPTIIESYAQHELYGYLNRFYAFPVGTPFDVGQLESSDSVLVGDSMDELKSKLKPAEL